MEKYKNTVKTRITIGGLYCCLVMVPNLILNHFLGGDAFTNFIMGALVGIQAIIIGMIIKYSVALRNEETLKKLYIKENDERLKYIRTKVGGSGLKVVLAGLLLAMMVSGYFSKTVFFTLFAVELFVALVMLSLKLYYSNKI